MTSRVTIALLFHITKKSWTLLTPEAWSAAHTFFNFKNKQLWWFNHSHDDMSPAIRFEGQWIHQLIFIFLIIHNIKKCDLTFMKEHICSWWCSRLKGKIYRQETKETVSFICCLDDYYCYNQFMRNIQLIREGLTFVIETSVKYRIG